MNSLNVIAKIKTNFSTKFGIPRQSGLVNTEAKIVFEKEYRDIAAVRGLENFSHLWIIWGFSENENIKWSPTVRPPRLGGNKKIGVFATRSPNRPNGLGLSSVIIKEILSDEKNGPTITVLGADLLDGTPIYDIKPYLAYTDSHPEAVCGFSDDVYGDKLNVLISDKFKQMIGNENILADIKAILQSDPRPAYHNDDRIYAFEYANFHIEFKVEKDILTVTEIKKEDK